MEPQVHIAAIGSSMNTEYSGSNRTYSKSNLFPPLSSQDEIDKEIRLNIFFGLRKVVVYFWKRQYLFDHTESNAHPDVSDFWHPDVAWEK